MSESDRPLIRISSAFAEAGVAVRLGCLTARVSVREDDPATKEALAELADRLELVFLQNQLLRLLLFCLREACPLYA